MRMIIHLGLPKSASSTLQVGLSACEGIIFLGLYPTCNVAEVPNQNFEHMEIPYLKDSRIKDFYAGFSFAKYDSRVQAELYQSICSDYADADKALFFSCEALTSPMFSEVTPKVKLERLVECCDDAEFLLISRNQEDVIKSQYRDWPFDLSVKGGRGLNLNEWCLNELRRSDDMGPGRWFDYQRLLEPLQGQFADGRLHVLLFEDFVHARERFCADLASLLKVDSALVEACLADVQANRGVSARYNAYRKFRRLLPASFSMRSIMPKPLLNSAFRFLNRGEAEVLELDDAVRDQLVEHFSASNRAVAEQLKLSLEGKGYWV